MRNSIVELNDCPACRAPAGAPCETPIDGVMTDWTHDLRVYADLANSIRVRREPTDEEWAAYL